MPHYLRYQANGSVVGVNKIYDLITCFCLKQSFTKKSCISLERFWDEATDVANTMVYIGNNLDILDLDGECIKEQVPLESLYSVGLFHDCGIPAIAQKHSNYKELLMLADRTNVSSNRLEGEQYNTQHEIVGFHICNCWISYLQLLAIAKTYLRNRIKAP
ncbi:MAG: HDOD domain-containing protein [Psychrosphaera sp.]|nr:HDOD domain-containing protein [Psychrosphaera sp.]